VDAPDRKTERQRIAIAAQELGKCTKTIRSYRDALREDGIVALTRTERSDKGTRRNISQPWIDLVLALYKRGQRSFCRSRNQVWLLIQGMTSKLLSDDWKTPEKRAELMEWYAQKLGAAAENAKSKLNKILGSIRKELEVGICMPPRSHMSVYGIIDDYLEQQHRKARHPGQGPEQVIQTTGGLLVIEVTNGIFQADHSGIDILLKDKDGNEIGYPYLTVIIECASGCVTGFYLGFRQPGSHEVALALRHAILPKQYGPEYELEKQWQCVGVPRYLVTDRATEFKSKHLKQIAAELGFELRYRAYPSQGGLVESVFDKVNKEVLSNLPGYKGSNVQKRPKNAEKYACLTIEDLEQELVRYFCDHYNQHFYPRMKDRTRAMQWEEKLMAPPVIPDERELDLCLLKRKQTAKVQKYGTIRFQNEIYQGDCLLGRETEKISFRYDPGNIIHILAYTVEETDKPSKFLGVLKARDRKEEKLSLHSLKLEQKLIRARGKKLDQSSIYNDALKRNERAERELHGLRKQQRRKEHERTGRSEGLGNVIDFKRQENEAKESQALQITPQPKPLKRLKPKQKAKVAAKNWQQKLSGNW
jgi:putative transposase